MDRIKSLVIVALFLVQGGALARQAREVEIIGVRPGSLLTRESSIHVRVDPRAQQAGVTFWFHPAGGGPPLYLGQDSTPEERSYAPDCGDGDCVVANEYSVELRHAVCGDWEGPGSISVLPIGEARRIAAVPVYWDPTPPKSVFVQPAFNQAAARSGGFSVVTQSMDQDLVAVNVYYFDAPILPFGRGIPRFEQHLHGAALSPGGHASCVPTAVAANLEWLDSTGQWNARPGLCGAGNHACFVGVLGFFMGTSATGTTGSGARDGLMDYLRVEFGYQEGTHYELEQDVVPLEAVILGFIGHRPDRLLEEFLTGASINVGIHNMPGDPGFGHYMAVDNVTLNHDDTATLILMDPNVEPPGSPQGMRRAFTLHPDGTLDWDVDVVGYYDPPSGKVKLDELLVLRPWASGLSFVGSRQRGGQVPGSLQKDGTWIGRFQPPAGSAGPWMLMTESVDAAGNLQRDYQYVGGGDDCGR